MDIRKDKLLSNTVSVKWKTWCWCKTPGSINCIATKNIKCTMLAKLKIESTILSVKKNWLT